MSNKKIPMLFACKEECCGCTACYAVCASRAISMIPDEEGFEYPCVDAAKCTRCYRCIAVCPMKAENPGDA